MNPSKPEKQKWPQYMQNWYTYLTVTTGPNTNIKTQNGFKKEIKPIQQKDTQTSFKK
jgi:hypothetical protein